MNKVLAQNPKDWNKKNYWFWITELTYTSVKDFKNCGYFSTGIKLL